MARGREWNVATYAPDIVVNDIPEAVHRILEAP
jgi:hypothetical protein